MPIGVVLLSRYFLQRSRLCDGQSHKQDKSIHALISSLYQTIDYCKWNKADWMERNGQLELSVFYTIWLYILTVSGTHPIWFFIMFDGAKSSMVIKS